MNQEARALIAGLLSLGVFLAWSHFWGPRQGVVEKRAVEVSSPAPVVVAPHKGNPFEQFPETVVRREGEEAVWEISSHGGVLKTVSLKKYHQGVLKESPLINLVPSPSEKGLDLICHNCNFELPPPSAYRLVSNEGEEVLFEASSPEIQVRKRVRPLKQGYLGTVTLQLINRTNRPLSGQIGLKWDGVKPPQPPGGFLNFLKGPANQRGYLYQLGGKLERGGTKEGGQETTGAISWAAIEDRYFIIALLNRRLSSDAHLVVSQNPQSVSIQLTPGGVTILPRGMAEEVFNLYLGPKDREVLKEVGVGLEKAVDYGIFSFLAVPMLKLLIFFQSWIRNWGLAIILLTILVKILLNPLSLKSLKQMKGMQNLQPQIAQLKEKYGNDKQRLNLEMMQLFKTHKVNPLGGCLPMLLQMPIYIALYKVLYNSIELYHAPFLGFYRDLSAPDPYFILPILLGIFMVLQQKMTPMTTVDPAQRQMMMIMPILFGLFMIFLPLGLVLYILVNTVMTVAQQYLHKRDLRLRDLLKISS